MVLSFQILENFISWKKYISWFSTEISTWFNTRHSISWKFSLILSKLQYTSLHVCSKAIIIRAEIFRSKFCFLVCTNPFSDAITSFNLHVTVFKLISRTQYHMEYIDTLKWRTKPFVSTLPLILFSCWNITFLVPTRFLVKGFRCGFFTRCIPCRG